MSSGQSRPRHQDTWRRAGLLQRGVVGGCAAELSPQAPDSFHTALIESDQSPVLGHASAAALQMLSKPPAYPALGRGVLGGGGGGTKGAGSSGAGPYTCSWGADLQCMRLLYIRCSRCVSCTSGQSWTGMLQLVQLQASPCFKRAAELLALLRARLPIDCLQGAVRGKSSPPASQLRCGPVVLPPRGRPQEGYHLLLLLLLGRGGARAPHAGPCTHQQLSSAGR